MFRTIATKIAPAAALLATIGVATLGATPAQAATVDTNVGSSGSTGMTLHITNDSNETMHVTSASNPYGHWQDRATDIPAHSSANVSDYSNNIEGAEIDLTYQMPNGTQIQVDGIVPLAGSNSVSASSSTTSYTATGQYASGYHPTFDVDVANA